MGWGGVGWGLLLRVWALHARVGCGIDALCKVVGGWVFSCSLGIHTTCSCPRVELSARSYQLGRPACVHERRSASCV
jgi:hypothetical protein